VRLVRPLRVVGHSPAERSTLSLFRHASARRRQARRRGLDFGPDGRSRAAHDIVHLRRFGMRAGSPTDMQGVVFHHRRASTTSRSGRRREPAFHDLERCTGKPSASCVHRSDDSCADVCPVVSTRTVQSTLHAYRLRRRFRRSALKGCARAGRPSSSGPSTFR